VRKSGKPALRCGKPRRAFLSSLNRQKESGYDFESAAAMIPLNAENAKRLFAVACQAAKTLPHTTTA
jgi:hypothetical protein